MIVSATIRTVWGPYQDGHFTVVVSPVPGFMPMVLRTYDVWLAALAERYEVPTGRQVVSIGYDAGTMELQSVALPA